MEDEELTPNRMSSHLQWQTDKVEQEQADEIALQKAKAQERRQKGLHSHRLDRRTIVVGTKEAIDRFKNYDNTVTIN